MINPNRILERKKFPYPYLTIENFFEEEFYKNIETDFPKRTEAGFPQRDFFLNDPYKVKRFHFETTYGDEFYSKLIARSNVFKLLHDFIYGEKFMKMFLDLFSKDIENEIGNGFLKSDIKNVSWHKDPYEVTKLFSKYDLKKNKEVFL